MIKERFVKKCKALNVITATELEDAWVEAGAERGSNMASTDIGKKFKELYPQLQRDCGAKVLDIVYKSKNGLKLNLDVSFAQDSLFCEWCYVIDLDKNTFEVYKGFNKKKLPKKARFYNRELNEKAGKEDVYTPVKLKKSWSLDNLPKDDAEFYKDLKWKE